MSATDPPASSECFAPRAALLAPAEAERRIAAATSAVRGRERVALRAALARVLCEDVVSGIDVPGHTNSALDGYALRGADLPPEGERALAVVGRSLAGAPHVGAVGPGEAVRITTGAVMPEGADTVVMQEDARRDGERVVIGAGHRPGQNVRRAGEDIARGATVLRAGRRLMPAELGLLASLGIGEVSVHRRLRVAILSTGDELRSIGEPLEPGAIYDSNRYTLYGMLTRLGADLLDLGVVADRREAVREALAEAASVADVVLSSGGASTGEADYVEEVLAELGEVGFWRIAIRPGRPLAFGRIGDAVFFGLPGNPVAVMVTFYEFVQPALRRMMGECDPRPCPPVRARLATPLPKRPGRVEYYRAVLALDDRGRAVVSQTGKPGSGLLHTMSDANCLVVLPEEAGPAAVGDEVLVQPFFGLV